LYFNVLVLNMYYCNQCNKNYKNLASLTSHKYRYHPYMDKVKLLNEKMQHSESDLELPRIDQNQVWKNQDQGWNNTMSIDLLKADLDRYKKLALKLDTQLMQIRTQQTGTGVKTANDTNYKEDVKLMKDQSETNKIKLSLLEKKVESLIETNIEFLSCFTNLKTSNFYKEDEDDSGSDNSNVSRQYSEKMEGDRQKFTEHLSDAEISEVHSEGINSNVKPSDDDTSTSTQSDTSSEQ
jgi:hypothetical protein